jgi:very-short-patch-repair endonuclease
MVQRRSELQLTNVRRLRRDMTVAETMLWQGLRNRGCGWKFRRQVPIGPYVADFACLGLKLIVELDGPPHDDPQQQLHDRRRDAWLRERGWHVLRFSNDLVIGGGDLIYEEIGRFIETIRAPATGLLQSSM